MPTTPPTFFLYLALQAVHEPVGTAALSEPLRAINDTVRRTYAGMVSAVDEGVVTSRRRWGEKMGDNTILVLSNDNGGWCGYQLSVPRPQNDSVGGRARPRLRVVAGKDKGGTRFGGLFRVTDWLPTLVAAAAPTPPRSASSLPLDASQWPRCRAPPPTPTPAPPPSRAPSSSTTSRA